MLFLLKQILNFNCIVIIFSLSLTGCTSLAILGVGAGAGVVTGGYIMGREKTVTQSVDDSVIDSQIRSELSKKFPGIFTNITIVTDNGCVLLAGNVQEEKYIQEAEKVAWSVNGVKHIDNNLICDKKISTSQSLKDGYITSACRTKLIATKDIKSRNIKIKTVSGTVYLSGTAQSKDKLEDIISVVKSIKGVEKVVSYIRVK